MRDWQDKPTAKQLNASFRELARLGAIAKQAQRERSRQARYEGIAREIFEYGLRLLDTGKGCTNEDLGVALRGLLNGSLTREDVRKLPVKVCLA